MKKLFKRVVITVLIFTITVSTAISASAAEVNNELSKLRLYLRDNNIQPQTAAETVIYEKTGLIMNGINPFFPQVNTTDAESLADFTAVLLADGLDPKAYEGTDYTALLKALQLEDGSFSGSPAATVKAFIVLSGTDTEFEKSAAADYILACQKQTGEFSWGENVMYETWLSIAALSGYTSSSSKIRSAISSAASYVKFAQTDGVFADDSASVVAYAILIVTDAADVAESDAYGNLMTSLMRFQNSDGSFRATADGEKTADREATMLALSALEAIRYGASEYKTLANNGGFNKGLDVEGLIPLLRIFAIIAALSAVMWIVVFIIKKPKTVTLDEFKEEAVKSIPKATEEDLDISKPKKKDRNR